MAPFRFRLEQVLQYRKQLEEQAMQRLGEARALRDATLARIHEIEAEREAQLDRLAKYHCMSAGERYVETHYATALRAEKQSALSRLAMQNSTVDLCRQQLIEKAQERSLLAKLREKQAKRFSIEERQYEQRTNDETATLRFTPPSF
jgi:flagellar export protein FliJ